MVRQVVVHGPSRRRHDLPPDHHALEQRVPYPHHPARIRGSVYEYEDELIYDYDVTSRHGYDRPAIESPSPFSDVYHAGAIEPAHFRVLPTGAIHAEPFHDRPQPIRARQSIGYGYVPNPHPYDEGSLFEPIATTAVENRRLEQPYRTPLPRQPMGDGMTWPTTYVREIEYRPPGNGYPMELGVPNHCVPGLGMPINAQFAPDDESSIRYYINSRYLTWGDDLYSKQFKSHVPHITASTSLQERPSPREDAIFSSQEDILKRWEDKIAKAVSVIQEKVERTCSPRVIRALRGINVGLGCLAVKTNQQVSPTWTVSDSGTPVYGPFADIVLNCEPTSAAAVSALTMEIFDILERLKRLRKSPKGLGPLSRLGWRLKVGDQCWVLRCQGPRLPAVCYLKAVVRDAEPMTRYFEYDESMGGDKENVYLPWLKLFRDQRACFS